MRELLLILAVLLAWFVAGCEETRETGADETAPKDIIGGMPTNYQSWKGVICVHGTCSGTLIDPEVVLTAGHCMTGSAELYLHPNEIQIIGGAYCSSQNLITYSSDAVMHPEWEGELTATAVDLAMIKLAQPVTEIEYHDVRSEELVYHEEGRIVGYGRSSNSGGFGTHRVGITYVVSQGGSVYGLDMIELGDGESTTCSGDSGGPFLTEYNGGWVVTGVCSMHIGDECILEANTFHVNAMPFRGWIDEVVVQFTGHGLPEVEEDTDTDTDTYEDVDTGTDTDTDTDTDSDTDVGDDDDDNDNDNDDDETDGGEPEPDPDDDSGCGCRSVGRGPMRSLAEGIVTTVLGIMKLFL